MGGENPLTIHEIYSALTPSDSRSDWASVSLLAVLLLNRQRIFVLFWPEISAYGVFINFDNERMRIAEHVIFVDRHVANTLSNNWEG